MKGTAVGFSLMAAVLLLAFGHLAPAAASEPHVNQTPECNADRTTWTVGVVYCDDRATEGYTLFSPIPSNTTYLIDQEGREMHRWTSPGEHRPALSAYLLPDGDLLRTANIASSAVGNFSGGGTGGKLERISWEGELEWSWEYSSELFIAHHDVEPMPNGNILMIAWEERTEAEALQAGRNPEIASDSPGGQNNIWPDHIVEVEPVGNDSARIVWRWHAWDHLIQDHDPSKDNYGVVADHPERININYAGGTGNAAGRADWMHCNGIDYNPILDQIALSCRSMHEIYIIDHSTTTEEAAGSSGGNAGMGGDILYRWGNPQVYHQGLSSDQQLYGQHDVNWIPEGHPYAGSLSIFNNGNGRYPAYSSVEILSPETHASGDYVLQSNGTFGPNAPNWSWDLGEAMYSGSISGVDALPNGNMLVTHGTQGTLFEIDAEGDVVWTYVNPVGPEGGYNQSEPVPPGQRAGTTANTVFKAHHVPLNHPAILEKKPVPMSYIERWTDQCPDEDAWGWDRDGDGCVDDSDQDGVRDPYDRCMGGDDGEDVDQDNVPDACDSLVDSDADGVADGEDACPGYNDSTDADNDGIPEPCDDLVDSDNDGVADGEDACPGYNDSVDADNDGVPEPCDDLVDADNDGVADGLDVCPGGDDAVDDDQDGSPNACDETPNGEGGGALNNGTADEDDEGQRANEATEGSTGLLTQVSVWFTMGIVLVGVALGGRRFRQNT